MMWSFASWSWSWVASMAMFASAATPVSRWYDYFNCLCWTWRLDCRRIWYFLFWRNFFYCWCLLHLLNRLASHYLILIHCLILQDVGALIASTSWYILRRGSWRLFRLLFLDIGAWNSCWGHIWYIGHIGHRRCRSIRSGWLGWTWIGWIRIGIRHDPNHGVTRIPTVRSRARTWSSVESCIDFERAKEFQQTRNQKKSEQVLEHKFCLECVCARLHVLKF